MIEQLLNLQTNNLVSSIEKYFDRLWPINRSLMGPGNRESLKIISEIMPHEILSFETGEDVFDWKVPQEWKVNEAYIIDPNGKKFCDFKKNNLHIIGYSVPFKGKLSLNTLKEHLYSLPNQPNAIPYITSYYKQRWGFCLTHKELEDLTEGEYYVCMDTEHYNGHLEVAEAILEGETKEEILFTSYICHPSMASNELSGPLALMFLFSVLKGITDRRFTYRFVLNPETLGSIAYLTKRGEHFKENLKAGYVITCAGDPGPLTYKLSKQEDSLADRAALATIKNYHNAKVIPYDPVFSSDERQYCSPGFNLPVGSLMRTQYGCYDEYHTSLDNRDYIKFSAIAEIVKAYSEIVFALESNVIYKNTVPNCDPQLGKRNLYPSLSTKPDYDEEFKAVFWLLSYANGKNDLLSIAERSGLNIKIMRATSKKFEQAGLLKALKM